MFKSIEKMPTILIEEYIDVFSEKLWEISDKSKEMGAALIQFQQDLQNFIINELYASSIVEEAH